VQIVLERSYFSSFNFAFIRTLLKPAGHGLPAALVFRTVKKDLQENVELKKQMRKRFGTRRIKQQSHV